MHAQTLQGEGLLPVSVQMPENEAVATPLIIQSLLGALEVCIHLDEQWKAENPSPALVWG